MSLSLFGLRSLLPDLAVDFRCAKTEQPISWLLVYDPQWGFVEPEKGVLLGLWVRMPNGERRICSDSRAIMEALHHGSFPVSGMHGTHVWFIFHDRSNVGRSGIRIIHGLHYAVCPYGARAVPSSLALKSA